MRKLKLDKQAVNTAFYVAIQLRGQERSIVI